MSPKLAGYRTFILGLAPFILAIVALVVLGLTRPDLLSISTVLQILGAGTGGPIAGLAARSVDKRTRKM